MGGAPARPQSLPMGDEHVWAKKGSRLELPRVPRPLRMATGVGAVSLSLVGLLAVPAGSPPPPPAVAAAPIAIEQPPNVQYCVVTGAPADPIVEDAPGTNARLVVYPEGGGIVEYNLATKKKTRILTGKNCGFLSAGFRDSTDVVVAEEQSVWIVDTVTGQTRELPIVPNKSRVLAMAVSSVFQAAVLTSDPAGSVGDMTLTMTGPGDNPISTNVAWSCGCEPAPLVDLQWSSDGNFLVVSVPSRGGSAVTVYSQDGRRFGKSFSGRLPRWIGSTEDLMVERTDAAGTNFDKVDLNGKIIGHFFTTHHDLAEATESPDGSKIAFGDESSGRTLVYDFEKNSLQAYGNMQMYPLWLGPMSIAVSKVVPCHCDSAAPPYTPVGPVSEIDLRSGAQHRLGLSQTFNADVWF